MNINNRKNILLVYPKYPDTFWSFAKVLKFISKKATLPPLGLLTVAAMLPTEWDKRLIDMNVSNIKDGDIKWADYVFISAMIVQKDSVKSLIKKCNDLGKRIVAGGPLFTSSYDEFEGIDHFVLGEAEITLPLFLKDLENDCAKPVYLSSERPSLDKTPVPLWSLIDMKHYVSMSVQYSRGCPFNCEFCDIIIMNGQIPRVKEPQQVINEFEALYKAGWRGSIFMVDDNFIGNKVSVKKLLPELTDWMKIRKDPFYFITEASINLADDEELMELMVKARILRVFIGIESPNDDSLAECSKFQNKRDMVASIKKMQNFGLEVLGGFIVGFDNDSPSIFEKQIKFIQQSGVVVAMVGLLNALPGTSLYNRLKKENRLLTISSGDNVDGTINFLPKMDLDTLIDGYKKILETIYSPKEYCDRVITFLKEYKFTKQFTIKVTDIKALLYSIWYLGIVGESKRYYWKLLSWSLVKRPRLFPIAVTMAIYGFHFKNISSR